MLRVTGRARHRNRRQQAVRRVGIKMRNLKGHGLKEGASTRMDAAIRHAGAPMRPWRSSQRLPQRYLRRAQ